MSVIAIDLGGTKIASALISDDGEVQARGHALLGGRGDAGVAALIVEQCDVMRAAARADAAPMAVGVAVPGIYRAERGTVWAPNIPGWDDYPLRAELCRALGAGTRVVIDSDRAAYILGETWRGAARGARDAIFLAVGTGIGAGILVNGTVLRGHADIAGAIGWLALDRPFREPYVGCGCFEYHASGPGLTGVARELIQDALPYSGELRQLSEAGLSTGDLFAAYDRGDDIARRTLDEAIELWGMAAANLVSLFNPETIIFGGGVFGPAVRFLDRIHAEARRWAQPISMQQVRFAASTLGGDAGLFGAARLALDATA